MLIYNPFFDPYHCVFRAAVILSTLKEKETEIERWRILDFYMLFPHILKEFSFPEDFKSLRSLIPHERRYRKISDPKRIFFRLEPIQITALKFLASHNIINPEAFAQRKRLIWTGANCPTALQDTISSHTEEPVVKLLTGPFSSIDLYGKGGLKARSDLFQYKYDTNPAKAI
jgi:hypothetical protein